MIHLQEPTMTLPLERFSFHANCQNQHQEHREQQQRVLHRPIDEVVSSADVQYTTEIARA